MTGETMRPTDIDATRTTPADHERARSTTRRWDVFGGLAALSTSAFDLALFAWAGLPVEDLTGHPTGVFVLVAFVVGYGALGFAAGRLWMARQRSVRQVAALETSRARLVQSEKLAAIGHLAAGIAHEVRNPLGVIRASASMVQESFELGSDDHRACELIRDETYRLDKLIGALLAFARPTQPRFVETELRGVVEHAVRLAREAGLNANAEVPDARVRGDGDLLTQLVFGLLTNAREAGAERATVTGAVDGPLVRLHVEDDGPGLRDDDAARVFEPFFTTKAGGTGLGLSMAARIVSAHGGTIAVTPVERGARFSIELPRRGPAVEAEAI